MTSERSFEFSFNFVPFDEQGLKNTGNVACLRVHSLGKDLLKMCKKLNM